MISAVIAVDVPSDCERREEGGEDEAFVGGGEFDHDGERPSSSDDDEEGGGGCRIDDHGRADHRGTLVHEIDSEDDDDDDDEDDDVDGDDGDDGVDRTLDDIFNSIAYANYLDDDSDDSEEEEVDCPVHRVLCGACDAIVSERSQCVNLLADARQCLYSTDIPCFSSIAADHTAVLPIETCDCVAEKVHCTACNGQVGYHVKHVCTFCERTGHNGHFWIFQSEKVKASAIEADADAAPDEKANVLAEKNAGVVEEDKALAEKHAGVTDEEEGSRGKQSAASDQETGVSRGRGGDAQLCHASPRRLRVRTTGEAAAVAAAARAGASIVGKGRDKNIEDDVREGEDVVAISNAAKAKPAGSGGGGGGGEKREGQNADGAQAAAVAAAAAAAAASCGGCNPPASVPTAPLLLWSALPYNGAPIATFRLLASTRLTPPSNIVCNICASVMHQPVRLRPCGHRGVCWGCAWREVDARGTCPFDRRTLVAEDLLPDEEARAEVEAFLAAAREAASTAAADATAAAATSPSTAAAAATAGEEDDVAGDALVGEGKRGGVGCRRGTKRQRSRQQLGEARDGDGDGDEEEEDEPRRRIGRDGRPSSCMSSGVPGRRPGHSVSVGPSVDSAPPLRRSKRNPS